METVHQPQDHDTSLEGTRTLPAPCNTAAAGASPQQQLTAIGNLLPTSQTTGGSDCYVQAAACPNDAGGSKSLFPSLGRLGYGSNQIMNQSTQQVATVIKKGAEWNKGVSEQVTSVFHRSHSTVTTAFSKSLTTFRNIKVGASVSTAYGVGKVVAYREATSMFEVRLSFGTLFTTNVTKTKTQKKLATTLELNSAYESWEQARRQSVEEECSKRGISFTEQTMHICFSCIKEPKTQAKPMLSDASGKPLFPMLYNLRQSGQDAVLNARKSESPCLLCAAVVCNRHSSEAFRKEGISVCQDCVECLDYDFASAPSPQDVDDYVQRLIDLYRRAHLLLQYCSQFMLVTADSLEKATKQHNHIGVGGSGAGLVSGALGIAAALSILTPAGPPLLVASIVFGGSATAVQTGSEAYKYYGEPNQFANRILTLQGIAERILVVVRTMRDNKLLPYLNQAMSIEDQKADNCTGHIPQQQSDQAATMKEAAKAGVRIGCNAATTASLFAQETAAAASTSASLFAQEATLTGRFVSRATTTAARTARFARFAGGALSAATMVLEAHEMRKTLDHIKLGSPCEKAEALRTVYANLNHMPSTVYVKNMCESYGKVRLNELFKAVVLHDTNRQSEPLLQLPVDNVAPSTATELVLFESTVSPKTVTDAAQPTTTNANPVEQWTQVARSDVDEEDWVLAEDVIAGLEAAQNVGSGTGGVASTNAPSSLSLLERIQRFKQREAERGR
jgi:hypothetical protein